MPVARLATVGLSGGPHLVPIVFAIEAERILSMVDQKPKTTTALKRLTNIESNHMASVLVDHYDEDWSRLWWVRVDGTAEIATSGSDRDAALTSLISKYSQYQTDPPHGPAIVISIETVTWWEASP